MYADDPIATIASFTAVGAFVSIAFGVVAQGTFRGLDSWVTLGIFCGGLAGVVATLLDALT
jgi:hypothetical protein